MPTNAESTAKSPDAEARSAAARKAWETIRARRAGLLPPTSIRTRQPKACCAALAAELLDVKRQLEQARRGIVPKPAKVLKFRKSSRKRKLLTDEECVASYEAMRAKFVAAYGVPYRPIAVECKSSKCVECKRTIDYVALCVYGVCANCRALSLRPRCHVCAKPSDLNESGVCAVCVPRWDDINKRAAEVAQQNAGGH